MKKFAVQALALIFLIFTALAYYTGSFPNLLVQNENLIEVSIKDATLKVMVAETPEKRRKGLGGKEKLASDSGMLFSFPEPGYYDFWMKGMLFPIDIIWIKDNRVVDITANASEWDLSILTPRSEVDSVLEVNAGFVSLHDIKIGDSITIKK